MSIFKLMDYETSFSKTWFGQIDPRLKLAYSIGILSTTIALPNSLVLIFILILNSSIFIWFFGFIRYFYSIYALRWFFLIYIIVLYSLGVPLDQQVGITFIQIHLISNSFLLFSKTTTPDQFMNTLVAIGLPAKIAWTITASIRQALFTFEDLIYIREIQRLRTGHYTKSRKQRYWTTLKESFTVFTTLFSRSIIIAEDYALTLKSRGWKKPHKELTLHALKFRHHDVYFIIFYLFFPLSIIFFLIYNY